MTKPASKIKRLSPDKILAKFQNAFASLLSEKTMIEYMACLKQLLQGTWKITSKSRYNQYKAVLTKLNEIGIDIGIKLPKFTKRGDNFKENVIDKNVTEAKFQKLIDSFPNTDKGKQARLACQIAFATGLRLSEVLSLTQSNIAENNGLVSFVVKGKGNKTRIVFFRGDSSILKNFTGFSITIGYLELAFTNARKACNLNCTFHSLRHSFATNLARLVSLPTLQKLLGHSNISTTSQYLHLNFDTDELKRAGF